MLINNETRVICQGFTGKKGTIYAEKMRSYGTNLVGGVSPGKGGEMHLDLPVFDSVYDAFTATKANTSVIFVPSKNCKEAIIEAAEAGIKLIVCMTAGIPAHDMVMIKHYLKYYYPQTRLIGPNCSGIIAPAYHCNLGMMPAHIYSEGSVGIISRSSILAYEVVQALTGRGIGQQLCVAIGEDAILGSDFKDMLQLMSEDPAIKLIVMMGEAHGWAEKKALDYLSATAVKPKVMVYLAGKSLPVEKLRTTILQPQAIEINPESSQTKLMILESLTQIEEIVQQNL